MTPRTPAALARTGAASLAIRLVSAVGAPDARLVGAERIAGSALVAIPDLTSGCQAEDRASLLPHIVASRADHRSLPVIMLDAGPQRTDGGQRGAFAADRPVPPSPSDAR
jgi:hypothetical protein